MQADYTFGSRASVEELKAYLFGVLSTVPWATIVVRNDKVALATPKVRHLLGCMPEPGADMVEVMGALGFSSQWQTLLQNDERKFNAVDEKVIINGQARYIRVTVGAMVLPMGDMSRGALVMMRDVTSEQVSAQEQVLAAFRSGLADQNSGLVHFIGNYVTGAMGALERLNKACAEAETLVNGLHQLLASGKFANDSYALAMDEEQVRLLRTVVTGLQRVVSDPMQHEVVEVTRVVEVISNVVGAGALSDKQGVSEILDLDLIAGYVVASEALRVEALGVQVKVRVEADVGAVKLPKNQFVQCLVMGFANAIDAIEEAAGVGAGGAANIPRVDLSFARFDDDNILVSLIDTGGGVGVQQVRDLFRMGFSTRVGRAGMGLHLMAVFIEQVGGSIDLVSREGEQGVALKLIVPAVSGIESDRV
ncbi:MAG TPA: hypothetical protein DE179_13375 [Oceanospirillaceae bacterium]|nr:hypothetical protein [Oceanospirillaceae bacterium]